MFICGANIAYMYFLVVKKKNLYFKQEEFKVYVYIIAIATIIVLFILLSNHIYPNGTFEYYLRTALFQVVAIITTTGFITDDFSYWPMMAKVILFLLFFAGGCFGSTTGSIKIPRWIITIKNAFKQLFATVHPRGVISVRLNNRLVPDNSIASTINYMIMFVSLIMIGGVLVCITGVPFYDAMCASVSCITNMGPSFGSLGSAGCYVILPAAAKIILSILMLIGRLEVYTFFVLLLPSVWRK